MKEKKIKGGGKERGKEERMRNKGGKQENRCKKQEIGR
jgi:hypothetical protein